MSPLTQRRGSLPNVSELATKSSQKVTQKQLCGPVRNVTSLYSKYRSDQKAKRTRFGYSLLGEGGEGLGRRRVDLETGEEHLLGANRRDSMGKSELEMRSMSPPWVAVVERVKDSIMKMKERLSSLQKLQQRRLLRVFDEDGGKGDIDVENTSSAITNLLHQSERGIKELDRYVVSGEQQEVVLNVQKALATQLSQVSMDFRTVQKQYMNEVRKRRSNSSSIGETSTAGVIDAGFTENQLLELEGIESQVETRSQEITKIAKSINELNSVFKELANLVVEQGTVLDRIDYNMENVAKDTAAANKELVRADETQKSGRVQKCLLALIAFIILNLLILTARA